MLNGRQAGVDLFDLICHVAYDQPPLTRKERANNVKKRNYFTKYGDQAKKVLEALLDKYADEGITNIESIEVLRVNPFDKFGSPLEIINEFGSKEKYLQAVKELENELYKLAQLDMIEDNHKEYKGLKKIIDNQGKLKSEGFRDLAIVCVAMANVQGGTIFIGIEDGEQIPPSGQKISSKITNETITRLRSLCFNVGIVLNDIETDTNGGQFFSLTIHPALKSIATTADGKIYVRIGDQCQPARSEDIVRLANEKDAFQWELQARNISLNDIPETNINWFTQEIRNSDRVKQVIKNLSNVEILEHYNLVEKNKLTNLGVLWLRKCFAKQVGLSTYRSVHCL